MHFDPATRIFVGRLPAQATEGELREIFSQAGEVVSVSIVLDRATGESRGFGFVHMSDPQGATRALALHGTELHGRPLRVVRAESKPASSDGPPDISPAPSPLGSAPPGLTWRGYLVVGGLVAAAAAALVWSFRPSPPAVLAPDPRAVVVLPMEVHGQAEGAEYFGMAFARAVAINLAQAPELRVLPVPSPEELQGGAEALAVTLGAGHLVRGALNRVSGDAALGSDGRAGPGRLEASLHLAVPTRSEPLLTLTRGADDDDAQGLAAGLAAAIMGHLGAEVPNQYVYVTDIAAGTRLAEAPATVVALRALRSGDVQGAQEPTLALTRTFPDELAAQVLRAQALVLQWDAHPTEEHAEALRQAMSRLDAIDPTNPYSAFYQGYMAYGAGRHREAADRFTRIVQRVDLAPSARAWVYRYRAVAKLSLDEEAGGLEDLSESHRLDPTNPWTLSIISAALSEGGRREEALARAQEALALMPRFWRSHELLGTVLGALGRWGEAAQAYGAACRLSSAQKSCSLQAVALYRAGEPSRAQGAAEHAIHMSDSIYGTYNLACYFALAGDANAALDYLTRSVRLGFNDSVIDSDADLAALREHPRFGALQEEVRRRQGLRK